MLIHFDKELVALPETEWSKTQMVDTFELPPNYDPIGKSFFEIACDCRILNSQT